MTTIASVYKTPRACVQCGKEYLPKRGRRVLMYVPSECCSRECTQRRSTWRQLDIASHEVAYIGEPV